LINLRYQTDELVFYKKKLVTLGDDVGEQSPWLEEIFTISFVIPLDVTSSAGKVTLPG